MNRGGEGRWGFGRDGFRAERQGHGAGQTIARGNVWERIAKQAKYQPDSNLSSHHQERKVEDKADQGKGDEH
jgi:hypothetical protein